MNKSKKAEDERLKEKKKFVLTLHRSGIKYKYIYIHIHILVMTAVKKKETHTHIHMVIE